MQELQDFFAILFDPFHFTNQDEPLTPQEIENRWSVMRAKQKLNKNARQNSSKPERN